MSYKSVVPFLEQIIADFILQLDGQRFYQFMEIYHEWLEQEGNAQELIFNLEKMNDIDSNSDRYYDLFREEIMSNIPTNIATDRELTLKHINDLYRAKGTVPSIKLLFKILYDEDIEIKYPSEKILKTSDGEWVKKTKIRIRKSEIESVPDELIGKEVLFTISKTQAFIESAVESITENSIAVYDIEISNISGNVVLGDKVEIIESSTEYSLETFANVFEIDHPGSGYSTNTIIPIKLQGNIIGNAKITVTGANGKIKEIVTISPVGFIYDGINTPVLDIPSITEEGQEEASVKILLNNSYNEDGYFNSTKGMLSSDIVIQDGKKYQDYSYTIKSNIPLNQYKDILKNTVHPAGVRFDEE